MEIRDIGKAAVLLYVGDLDPAGVLIDVDILRKMRLHLPGHDVRLRRLAITETQVLGVRPTHEATQGDRAETARPT